MGPSSAWTWKLVSGARIFSCCLTTLRDDRTWVLVLGTRSGRSEEVVILVRAWPTRAIHLPLVRPRSRSSDPIRSEKFRIVRGRSGHYRVCTCATTPKRNPTSSVRLEDTMARCSGPYNASPPLGEEHISDTTRPAAAARDRSRETTRIRDHQHHEQSLFGGDAQTWA